MKNIKMKSLKERAISIFGGLLCALIGFVVIFLVVFITNFFSFVITEIKASPVNCKTICYYYDYVDSEKYELIENKPIDISLGNMTITDEWFCRDDFGNVYKISHTYKFFKANTEITEIKSKHENGTILAVDYSGEIVRPFQMPECPHKTEGGLNNEKHE